MKRLMILMAAAVLAATGIAKDIIWTGALNSTWDKDTTANWKEASTGDPCTFADGDNVTFDDTAANKTVNLGAGNIKPATITFDHTADYSWTSTSSAANYIGGTVASFTKKGSGTLTISSSYTVFSRMTCNFDLQAGMVVLETANNTQLLGDGTNVGGKNKLFKVYIRNGATLSANKLTLGYWADVVVEPGGTYDWDGTAWTRQTFANLTLFGGAIFDLSAIAGTKFGYELFSVTNQLCFTGTTPYVLDQNEANKAKDQPLGLWPTTQIKVDDVTGDDGVDATISLKMIDANGTAAVPGGFVKTGAGTLLLSGNKSGYESQGKYNSFSGDIIVREGTLMAGVTENASVTLANILGSTEVDRTVTVEEGATFCFPNRNLLGSLAAISNPVSKLAWDIKGSLVISNGQSAVLGNVTFDGGSMAPSYGLGNFGRLMVPGTMAFKGAKTYSFPMSTGQAKANSFTLNGEPQTVFDVQDAAGLATFDIPFMIAGGYFTDLAAGKCGEFKFGFRKTGAGTMRIAAAKLPNETIAGTGYTNRGFNGTASVEAGTLAIDGNISVAEGVAVSSGASLAGTGTVQNVTLADGAGWRIRATDADPLEIKGNLTVNGTPRIDIEAGTAKAKRAIAKVAGTITGSFEGAPVYVDGVLDGTWKATIRNNELVVGEAKGLLFVVR